jgi:hypothetical protein
MTCENDSDSQSFRDPSWENDGWTMIVKILGVISTPFVATKEIWGMIWEKGGRRHKIDGPTAAPPAAAADDHLTMTAVTHKHVSSGSCTASRQPYPLPPLALPNVRKLE